MAQCFSLNEIMEKITKPVLLLMSLVSLVQSLAFTIDPNASPLFEVSETFLSVAYDTNNIPGRFPNFNTSDPYLIKLVRHLSPMYFRIGGTTADQTSFLDDTKGSVNLSSIGADTQSLLASDWLKMYQFTQNANVRIIYDLNSLSRNQDGSWNSENAELMIKFSNDHKMSLDWELGNEPDLYNAIFKTSVSSSQLAKDYAKLRGILDQYDLYKSSYLIGNDMFDVGSNQGTQDYLSNFLKLAADKIHAVTWHQYYFPGKSATEQLFLDPNTFNYLEQRTNIVKNVVATSGNDKKIWLGETSSAYNGGAAGFTDRFLASFLWLDKLGLGAKLGLDTIIRQAIFHSDDTNIYCLIDTSHVPNPDWWVSLLYKQLVGTKVLSVSHDGTSTNSVRMYSHCAKPNKLWGNSAIVVFGFNLANWNANVTISGFTIDSTVYAYELTPESDLYSKSVRLNGNVLSVLSNGDLPEMSPKQIKLDYNTYNIQPLSLVYLVVPTSNVTACK